MEDQKKCKHCAMMIPKEAKICPHCRKKMPLSGVKIIVISVIGFLLIWFVFILPSMNTPSRTPPSDGEPTSAAQKCREVTDKNLLYYAEASQIYKLFYLAKSSKETSDNYLNDLNESGYVHPVGFDRQVYLSDRVNFSLYSPNDLPVYQIADFKTRKRIGWIVGEEAKKLKPCK